MGGGDGFAGSVQNDARTLFTHGGGPLERGYATVGTDTGHAGQVFEAGWALDHPERQENFGHRAIHLTAEAAKSIAGYYYDRAPDYSYFVGCSRGGGQGMVASQRYPDDFDGIVAAAPGPTTGPGRRPRTCRTSRRFTRTGTSRTPCSRRPCSSCSGRASSPPATTATASRTAS